MKKEQSKKKYGFKWVFLNCIDKIYVFDFEKDSIERIDLPANAETLFNNETEKLRHSCPWADGTRLK